MDMKETQSNIPNIKVRIDNMINKDDSRVRAIASVTIGDTFAVHGIKVIDSDKGLFVSMPQSVYEKNGKTKYSDVFHAITSDARIKLSNAVLRAYAAQTMFEDEEINDTHENNEEQNDSGSNWQEISPQYN